MIAIIDYGMGNANSVLKAFMYVGATAFIVQEANELDKFEKIVLPGVGAFGDAMKNLEEKGFLKALEKNVINEKKPFLGICLGMQLTACLGFESGKMDGFSWFKNSKVKKFDNIYPLKIPHVGWNNIKIINNGHKLLENIDSGTDFYFVHSYHYDCNDEYIVATCNYGYDFPVAISYQNIFAVQFHPEKSQKSGLTLLDNFRKLEA